jgi:cobalt/nickel transport system permease protein
MPIPFSDPYRPGSSLVHRLDPRARLVAALGFILAVNLMPTRARPLYLPYLGLGLAVIVVSQVGVGYIFKRALLGLPFTLAGLPLAFSMPGPRLVEWGCLGLSSAGSLHLASLALKSWLSLQMALVLVTTTPFADLLWALRALRLPRTLVAVTGLMYRYLFILIDQATRLSRARAARSGLSATGRPGQGLAWRAQVTGGLVGNLFLRSCERSERVYQAMLSRGYAGEIETLAPPHLAWRDIVLSAALLIPSSGLLVLSAWMR